MSKLVSRKFLTSLTTIILIVLNRKLNIGLNEPELAVIVAIVVVYLLGQSLIDAKN